MFHCNAQFQIYSKMSSLTRERQLKRLNGIKYWIDIRDFSKKMSWDSGREIYSRKFKISESVFSIDIYPNGNTEEQDGHVGVYLQNENRWKVKCAVTFTVKHHVKRTGDKYVGKRQGYGIPEFVSHEEVLNLLNEDRGLTLEVDVELLEEEVTVLRPVDSEGDALLNLTSEVSAIKEEQESQKKEILDMKHSIFRKLKQMREEISTGLNKVMDKIAADSDAGGTTNLVSPSAPGQEPDLQATIKTYIFSWLPNFNL